MSLDRIPTDPSEELMRLMGRLQKLPHSDEIIAVPEHLFNEAVGMIRQQKLMPTIARGGKVVLFCQQWITPGS